MYCDVKSVVVCYVKSVHTIQILLVEFQVILKVKKDNTHSNISFVTHFEALEVLVEGLEVVECEGQQDGGQNDVSADQLRRDVLLDRDVAEAHGLLVMCVCVVEVLGKYAHIMSHSNN